MIKNLKQKMMNLIQGIVYLFSAISLGEIFSLDLNSLLHLLGLGFYNVTYYKFFKVKKYKELI